MKTALTAFIDGAGRVRRAPALILAVFAATLIVAIPPGLVLKADLAERLGNSLAAADMARGVNSEWWELYSESATGLGRSFSPTIIGFAAPLDNLSRFFDRQPQVLPVAVVGGLYLVLWLFLSGGVIDRLARSRPVRTHAFFAACGTYFVRFLRLAVIAALGYWVLFGFVHGWLFDRIYRWATIDLNVERTAFVIRLALYAVFGGLVVVWTLMLDYARVRAVVEDRHSMLGALIAGSRFALRHPAKTGIVWLLNGVCFLVVLGIYGLVAPGAAGTGAAVWLAFAIGQAYVLARVCLKLLVYASQTALFQSMLAHAEYTAAPMPVWPESATVESMKNAAPPQG
jgi:hypothetical protein